MARDEVIPIPALRLDRTKDARMVLCYGGSKRSCKGHFTLAHIRAQEGISANRCLIRGPKSKTL